MVRAYADDAETRTQSRARLHQLRDRVLAEVPGAAVAADQAYRESDLAIDFCEDVVPLDASEVARIVDVLHDGGATAKVSSIHVNAWFGSYDKLGMTRRLARERLGLDIDLDRGQVIYCGDSPNDAPMFAHFPLACGVANVADFSDRLPASGKWANIGASLGLSPQ